MKSKLIDEEIESSILRIKNRESKIESEIVELSQKIEYYILWAWRFVKLGALIIILGVIWLIIVKSTDLNLLGDFLSGTVGSIWSLSGLFFIYVAFLGQKQQLLNQQLEIMYSQLELKYTRQELYGQREEMKTQNETLKQQRFENTFFQLLNLFNSIVNSIDIQDRQSKSIILQGRDCFKDFNDKFIRYIYSEMQGNDYKKPVDLSDSTIEQIDIAYDNFYNNNKSDLSHYFRTIYHIFKFIDESKIDDKKRYIAIARAQLSSYEQILLFYNCLHSNGRNKFKPLIEKYAIFENIDTSLILSPSHRNKYKTTAFISLLKNG